MTIRYGKVLALSTNIFFSARGHLGVQDPLLEPPAVIWILSEVESWNLNRR